MVDTTNNFSQDGIIRIQYPTDWKYANIYPPHGFYSSYLATKKGGAYFLRIKVFNFSERPLLSNIFTEPAMQLIDGEPYLGSLLEGQVITAGTSTVQLDDKATTT
ncbi:MAG: hypothetical protein JTT14_03025, partial [Candidatus Brockarchaeota archaeon]|nr:hypothetical protein [Candidatus Brockarchaeota archaeon]